MPLDRLRSSLAAHLARYSSRRSPRSVGPLVELTGGWSSSLYTCTLHEGGAPVATVVLKMYAPNARGREHATREWTALTRLHAAGHLVPRVVLFEPEARLLGHPFIVMEHVAGRSFWRVLDAADPASRARPRRRSWLSW